MSTNYEALIHKWRTKPVTFVQDVIGHHLTQEELDEKGKKYGTNPGPMGTHYLLDAAQVDIFQSLANLCFVQWKKGNGVKLHDVETKISKKKGVSTMAGKGCGKTALASLVAIWFLVCYDKSKVFLVGPKYDQIMAGLFPEISKWYTRSIEVYGVNGNYLKEVLDIKGETVIYKGLQDKSLNAAKGWAIKIITFGQSSNAKENTVAIQGKHADNMLFITDEAPGIPNYVFDAIDDTCTQDNNVIFNIFNPNKNTGWAIDAHSDKMKDYWITHHINCENSTLVTDDHIEYMQHKFGVDSNMYRVNVLGLPPLTDDGSFISYEWIRKSIELYDSYEPEDSSPLILSLDVGGGGDDSMCAIMKGRKLLSFEKNTSPNTEVIAAWYEQLISDYDPDEYYIDSVGIGQGVYDKLHAMGYTKLKGIKGNSSPKRDRFYCIRDELGFKLREALQDGNLYLPDDEQLISEISLLREDEEHKSGKFKLLSKKNAGFKREMRGKLGYESPNKLDALMMCFYNTYEVTMRIKERKKDRSYQQFNIIQQLDNAWMAL